jgi:hypothetical protein
MVSFPFEHPCDGVQAEVKQSWSFVCTISVVWTVALEYSMFSNDHSCCGWNDASHLSPNTQGGAAPRQHPPVCGIGGGDGRGGCGDGDGGGGGPKHGVATPLNMSHGNPLKSGGDARDPARARLSAAAITCLSNGQTAWTGQLVTAVVNSPCCCAAPRPEASISPVTLLSYAMILSCLPAPLKQQGSFSCRI